MTAQGRVGYDIGEYGGEPTGFRINIAELTATNIAAQTTLINTFRAKLGNIILGTVKKEEVTAHSNGLTNLLPSDVNAQRERKWLVAYQDVTQFLDAPDNTINNTGYHKTFTSEIPTADLSLLTSRADVVYGDDPDLGTELSEFKTAWEALVKSPYNGATEILSFTAVGRDL